MQRGSVKRQTGSFSNLHDFYKKYPARPGGLWQKTRRLSPADPSPGFFRLTDPFPFVILETIHSPEVTVMQRDRVYLPKSIPPSFATGQADPLPRLMAILESSFDGIFLTDAQGLPLWCNHSYEVISGLRARDVLGIPMRELVARGTISQSATLLALEEGRPVTIDQTFTTGKRALVTSTPIYDREDRICLVVTNVRDISELIALQETLGHYRSLSDRYQQEISVIREQLMGTPQLVAEDPATLNLLRIVSRAAQLDTVVLIQGETGAGKEQVASYIHQRSPRAGKSFIRVNCGAIPENLAESELFGYERGAFTGANREGKAGLFEVAHEGTIFLDEVGELSLATQTKLLRVLQEKELTRVGGSKPVKIDVRVIAATNRDLQKCVAEGTFRQDLYYRLSVFPVRVPPLRERRGDIPKLARNVIDELNQNYEHKKTLSAGAETALLQYDWPGNVRELRNVMERAFIMSDGEEIHAEDLAIVEYGNLHPPTTISPSYGAPPAGQTTASPPPTLGSESLQIQVARYEAALIGQALAETGSLRAAARRLQMDPATFLRRKKKYQALGYLSPD